MPAKSDNLKILYTRTRSVLGMLIVQFLLGMGVNLIGNPDSKVTKVVDGIVLLLHVFLAIGLVVVSILIIRAAFKIGGEWTKLTRVGGAGVGLAFIGGIGVMASGGSLANWLSYLMSIGFILAFCGFGFLYVKLYSAIQAA